MKHVRRAALAASAFTCAALFSFGWSEQRGVSLAVESAQARIGRPLTPLSVAGVARRNYRRAAYGYGAGLVGAGLAAGAVGAAYYSGYPGSYYGYGYPGSYYSSYGYPGSYYSTYAYPGSYYGGSYAAYTGGYYGGGYANRSYITGRPTLLPRYYGGWSW
jgi:hypothetical protein